MGQVEKSLRLLLFSRSFLRNVLAGKLSKVAGKSLKLASKPFNPAGKASNPAGKVPKPAGKPKKSEDISLKSALIM